MKRLNIVMKHIEIPKANDEERGVRELLGEPWTDGELYDAKHIWSCICEGVDCSLTIARMRELKKRGLVTDIKVKSGRGKYANRYQYMWTDKLEKIVESVLEMSPHPD